MRNNILPTLLFCFVTSQVLAQTEVSERKVHFGIIAGSHIFGETFTYEKIATVKGAVLGLDLSYNFSPRKSGLSFHVQPNWSNYIRSNRDIYTSYNYKIQSVNLPMLLRYTFFSGKIRPFVDAGLNVRSRTSFNININGEICRETPSTCVTGEENINLHPQTTRDRIGVLAGAGVEFDVWRVTIPVTVRLNEGIGTYKMKNMLQDASYYDDIKTRNIQITTGITF